MGVIMRNDGTVNRSQSLRSISEYSGKHRIGVKQVQIVRLNDGGGMLYVDWSDNTSGYAHFSDYTVLQAWVNRKLHNRNSWWMGADYSEHVEGEE